MTDEADAGAEGETEPWELVVEDLHTTAAEYREEGWEVVELLPDLVGVLDAESAPERQGGFDLVVGREPFGTLAGTVEGHEFDAFELFRAEEGGVVYLVVAIEDTAGELAVLAAMTYEGDARERVAELVETGRVYVHARPEMGATDERVTFTLEDPSGLVPEASGE